MGNPISAVPSAPPGTQELPNRPPPHNPGFPDNDASGGNETVCVDKHPSIWSRVGSGIYKATTIPTKILSTAGSVITFAGYSVTTLCATGVAAVVGAARGAVEIASNYVNREQYDKKILSEYAIDHAKKTFTFMKEFYDDMSEDAAEKIFAGLFATVAVVGGIALMVAGCKNSSNHNGNTNTGRSENRCRSSNTVDNFLFYHWVFGGNRTTVINNNYGIPNNSLSNEGCLPVADSSNATTDDKKPSTLANIAKNYFRPYKVVTDLQARVMDHTKNFITPETS